MTIDVGSYVIVKKIGGEHLRLCRVRKGESILIEKLRFNIDGAVGKSYGLYEAVAGKISPVVVTETLPSAAPEECILEDNKAAESIEMKENSEESESDVPKKRQKLTQVEIATLKEAGVSTNELISKLVDGNRSFQDRTEFSQLKYREKKTKKHSDRVLIVKPTVRLLVDSYFKRDPERICHLRIDLLGHVLQLSSIRVGSRVFVYEQTLGLLGAAVIERLAGEGTCVFLHRYQVPQSIPSIFAMEFNEKLSTFRPLRLATFLESFKRTSAAIVAQLGEMSTGNDDDTVLAQPTAMSLVDDAPIKSELPDETTDTIADADEEDLVIEEEVFPNTTGKEDDDPDAEKRYRERVESEEVALELLRLGSGGFEDAGSLDAILLAVSSTDAEDLLERTYASLRLSGTIVVYSSVREQIVNVYNWLRRSGAVDVQVVDHFFRYYQVLPDRTHPLMRQTIPGGYILSAVKVKA